MAPELSLGPAWGTAVRFCRGLVGEQGAFLRSWPGVSHGHWSCGCGSSRQFSNLPPRTLYVNTQLLLKIFMLLHIPLCYGEGNVCLWVAVCVGGSFLFCGQHKKQFRAEVFGLAKSKCESISIAIASGCGATVSIKCLTSFYCLIFDS